MFFCKFLLYCLLSGSAVSAVFVNSRLKSRSTRSLSLYMLGYNSAKSSHTDCRKSDIPLRIRFTRFFLLEFTEMFSMISGMSFSQKDAIRILDRSVILLLKHFNTSCFPHNTPVTLHAMTGIPMLGVIRNLRILTVLVLFLVHVHLLPNISNHYELHHTYIHQQHCITVSNQHNGPNLEACLSSFLFIQ